MNQHMAYKYNCNLNIIINTYKPIMFASHIKCQNTHMHTTNAPVCILTPTHK